MRSFPFGYSVTTKLFTHSVALSTGAIIPLLSSLSSVSLNTLFFEYGNL